MMRSDLLNPGQGQAGQGELMCYIKVARCCHISIDHKYKDLLDPLFVFQDYRH